MRLINTVTLQLEEFMNTDNLKYAILSHRWEDEEVSFQEYWQGQSTAKRGYKKIRKFCHIARATGLAYGWVDTCCIDKSSSAELSEAINSMFRWYRDAVLCLVYMSDVCIDTRDAAFQDKFKSSAWFTRGWTLQELLAPTNLYFQNANWQSLGSKVELAELIAQSSHIDTDVLLAPPDTILSFPISRKMSWAVNRATTRPEDRAYSLMGIFNVNMPMLYGEGGQKAFRRLQEEIIRTSSDHTIFVWSGVEEHGSGMLASSIDQFADSASYVPFERVDHEGFQISNVGLTISLELLPRSSNTYLAFLKCRQGSSATAIFLKRIGTKSYRRVKRGLKDIEHMSSVFSATYSLHIMEVRRITVLHGSQNLNLMDKFDDDIRYRGPQKVSINSSGPIDIRRHCESQGHWDPKSGVVDFSGGSRREMITMNLQDAGTVIRRIDVGLNLDLCPVVVVRTSTSVHYWTQEVKCTRLSEDTADEVYLQPFTQNNTKLGSFENQYWKFSVESGGVRSQVFLKRRDEVMGCVMLEFSNYEKCWRLDFDTNYFKMLQRPRTTC